MSTIDHHTVPSAVPEPAPLDAARARRRLDHLLDLRSRLAVLAAERSAHGLDDALDIYGQQLTVEHAIDEEFPAVYAERFPKWVEQEAALEHNPERLLPDCGICRAIAEQAGVNLTPPEAA